LKSSLIKSASDILGLSDPSTIELDDDSLLFEDYEEGDDDEDYSEVTYDYEYEDDEEEDENEDDDYYEEKTIVKTVVAKPKRPAVVAPAPRPAYNYQPRRPPPPPANRRPQYAATGAAGYAGAYGARRRPHTPPGSSSGAQFLGQVEGLLGEAEHSLDQGLSPHITLTGSLREALLR
jgi:hypothetical protein